MYRVTTKNATLYRWAPSATWVGQGSFGQRWAYAEALIEINNGSNKMRPPPPPTHTHPSSETLQWLRQRCGGRLISRCDTEWAARSPDLTPPPQKILFVGLFERYRYEANPQTIAELKWAITARIRAISVEECVRVIDIFARRLQVCLQCRGGHLEHNFGKDIKPRRFDSQT